MRSLKLAAKRMAKEMRSRAGLPRRAISKRPASARRPNSKPSCTDLQNVCVRVGSDCTGLGTEILAFEGLQLQHPVVHCFASEKDEAIQAVLKASHSIKHVYTDVTERNVNSTPVVDIYVNTSPCQPFSMMGSGVPMY